MRSVESSHDTNSTQRRSVQSVKDTTRGGSRTRGARHPGLDLLAGALSSGSEPPSGRPKCRTREPSGRTRRRRRKKRSSREKAKTRAPPSSPIFARLWRTRMSAARIRKGADLPTVLRVPGILTITNLLQVLIHAVISEAPGQTRSRSTVRSSLLTPVLNEIARAYHHVSSVRRNVLVVTCLRVLRPQELARILLE